MNLLFNFYAKTQIQFITLIGKHKKLTEVFIFYFYIINDNTGNFHFILLYEYFF